MFQGGGCESLVDMQEVYDVGGKDAKRREEMRRCESE